MDFKTEYLKISFIDIGGNWGYAVMHIRDDNGEKKIRVAKCRKRSGFPAIDKWLWQEVDPIHIENLSQVNKINFKKETEIEMCFQKAKEEIQLLGNDEN